MFFTANNEATNKKKSTQQSTTTAWKRACENNKTHTHLLAYLREKRKKDRKIGGKGGKIAEKGQTVSS